MYEAVERAGIVAIKGKDPKTDKEIVRLAPKVILLVDHSKFGGTSTAFVAPITSVSTIVTDNQTPVEVQDDIRALGIEVIAV